MIGGTLGTLSMISHGLDIVDNDERIAFRKILYDEEGSLIGNFNYSNRESPNMVSRKIGLTTTSHFDQIVFKMKDTRLIEDDVHCITFIGENHTSKTPMSKSDSYNVKVWSLCTLLKMKYEKTVSVYLEQDVQWSHKERFTRTNDLIKTAYEENKELVRILNTNKVEDINFILPSKDGEYMFRVTKKPHSQAIIRLFDGYGSQGLSNTVHKLLEYSFKICDCDHVNGINFIDNRDYELGKYDSSDYYRGLYFIDISSLENFGWNKLLNFIGFLIKFYKKDDKHADVSSEENFDIKYFAIGPIFNNLTNNSTNFGNEFFTNLFAFADVTRDFYYDFLKLIYKKMQQGSSNDSVISFLFEKRNIVTESSIFSKFNTIINTINTIIDESDVIDETQKQQQGFNILFGSVDNIASVSYGQVIRATMTKIVDYNAFINIYNNIFAFSNDDYRPNYHIFVEGSSHAIFQKTCFMVAGFEYETIQPNKIIKRNNSSSILETYSLQSEEPIYISDITHMFYPKKV